LEVTAPSVLSIGCSSGMARGSGQAVAMMRRHSWRAVGFGAYCKRVFHVFQMFQKYVAIVSCGSCIMDPCCRHVMLGVVSSGEEGEGLLMLDVACNMGQHGLLGCCVKGARGSPLMLDVACNMGRLDFDLMVELL
jgi:hypothetical protein